MLPAHLDECPRCGENLRNPSAGISIKEIFQLTGVVVLIAVIPFIFLIGGAVICVLSMR